MTSSARLAIAAEEHFRARFEAHADATIAAAQKKYMKSALAFHGVTNAVVREASRELTSAHPELDRAALRAVAEHLFATEWFDLRSAAIAVLERKKKALRADDVEWLVTLVREAGCWAHVDWLAANVISAPLGEGARATARIRAWARDPDVWVRRTSLLVQLVALRSGKGDFELFAEIAVPMLGEKEFWIRKALGWVLRDTSKKRPELVASFLREHASECSGLTLREASKHLPEQLKTNLLAGHRPRSSRSTKR